MWPERGLKQALPVGMACSNGMDHFPRDVPLGQSTKPNFGERISRGCVASRAADISSPSTGRVGWYPNKTMKKRDYCVCNVHVILIVFKKYQNISKCVVYCFGRTRFKWMSSRSFHHFSPFRGTCATQGVDLRRRRKAKRPCRAPPSGVFRVLPAQTQDQGTMLAWLQCEHFGVSNLELVFAYSCCPSFEDHTIPHPFPMGFSEDRRLT